MIDQARLVRFACGHEGRRLARRGRSLLGWPIRCRSLGNHCSGATRISGS